jgi:hypothetical protein
MIRATSAVIATSALVMLSTGPSAQTTGVAVCDDFLKKYEACVASKVPAAQKTMFKGQLDQMRKAGRMPPKLRAPRRPWRARASRAPIK